MDVFRRCRAYLSERWGWVVTLAGFCIHFVCFGIYYSFNITFLALQEEFQTTSTATSWVGTIPIGLSTLAGIFVMPLIYRFSNRAITLLGIILCFTSCMVTSLITIFPLIYLTYSVLYGVGCACASLASIDLILRYFPVTNCTRATMFAMIGSSAGMLCIGPFTYFLIEQWGWRIMWRVVGGLLLVVGVASVLALSPPSSPISTSSKEGDDDNKNGEKTGNKANSIPNSAREKLEVKDDCTNHRERPKYARLDDDDPTEDGGANNDDKCEESGEEKTPFLEENIGDDEKKVFSSLTRDSCDTCDKSVVMDAGNLPAPADVARVEAEGEVEESVNFWTKHRAIFYPDVWVLGCCIMGLGVMNSFFYINMGDYLLSVGFEKRVVPWVVTTLGVTEMVGKCLLGVISDRLPFPKIFLYLVGSLTGIGCMICLLVVQSVVLLILLSVVIGLVVMTIADVLSYSICNQVFRNEDAVHTWTIVMVMQGIGFMVAAVFGESIDKTGSYNEAIYTSMGMYAVCALLCVAVPIYQKIFARHRFVMFEHQAKCRRLKKGTTVKTAEEMAASAV
ncbi:monocarboxylate transporter 9-like [Lytechinus variegatus]|uniref:monocarboxylate transporter 9-like n=1 Tax=Lytechinus variegatus TaxID=7654 RepID=UPI001BB2C94F|nr:monocarboxylate transporter 9-like [Lytechinus variegatus]